MLVIEISAAELNKLIADAGVSGGMIGLVLGIFIMAFFIWMLKKAYERNFKMWLLHLDVKEQEEINLLLEDAYKTFDSLSKSNTRLFKTWYNDLMRLKSYLAQKWLQN